MGKIQQHYKRWEEKPVMECPACKEIEFKHVDTLSMLGKSDVLEYECSNCHEYATFDEPIPKTDSVAVIYTESTLSHAAGVMEGIAYIAEQGWVLSETNIKQIKKVAQTLRDLRDSK